MYLHECPAPPFRSACLLVVNQTFCTCVHQSRLLLILSPRCLGFFSLLIFPLFSVKWRYVIRSNFKKGFDFLNNAIKFAQQLDVSSIKQASVTNCTVTQDIRMIAQFVLRTLLAKIYILGSLCTLGLIDPLRGVLVQWAMVKWSYRRHWWILI